MGLLKGLDPLLTADLLHVLRSMGHGDQLIVCDCNFPAYEISTHTTSKKCIILTTLSLPATLDAITSVLPLDFFVDVPVRHMAPQEGVALPPSGVEMLEESRNAIWKNSPGTKIEPVERFQFYKEARKTFAVVQTLERRPYGNFILQKGVVGPDGSDLKP